MTNENKKNYITEYNNLINAVITTHNDLKIKSQLAYENAVQHAIAFGDWFLLADFINKLLANKITNAKHLFNIMKATNKGLIYNAKKASISQSKDFAKDQTTILSSIWSDSLTESKQKQMQVFDENKLMFAIQNLIKKAIKNGLQNDKIKTILTNETTKI